MIKNQQTNNTKKMKKSEVILIAIIVFFTFILGIFIYKAIISNEVQNLNKENQKLKEQIMINDLRYKDLEINYRFLQSQKDSVIKDIDTLIVKKYEKINNVKLISPDSVLLIFTNYVSNKSNL